MNELKIMDYAGVHEGRFAIEKADRYWSADPRSYGEKEAVGLWVRKVDTLHWDARAVGHLTLAGEGAFDLLDPAIFRRRFLHIENKKIRQATPREVAEDTLKLTRNVHVIPVNSLGQLPTTKTVGLP